MSLDSDVVLLGTGLAPLIAANQLLAEGKSVLILNPDFDFFLEDSELPFDPLLNLKGPGFEPPSPQSLAKSSPERVIGALRPVFPGSVEFWSGEGSSGFHDPSAPHVRQRSRLWVTTQPEQFQDLDDFFVETSDAGLNPQLFEDIAAMKRFPGFSGKEASVRGLWIPKFCDVDVPRFRNGVLEFVRERLGSARIVTSATQIELIPEGIRFHSQGSAHTARISERMIAFWTPRLTNWIQSQAKNLGVAVKPPRGIRLWEEWSLVSRESLDPADIGVFENLAVWTEVEGDPLDSVVPLNRLGVLRAGELHSIDAVGSVSSWASGESFSALSRLCVNLLKWDRFSVRGMKARALFEWEGGPKTWSLSEREPKIEIICGCEGALSDVVRVALEAVG